MIREEYSGVITLLTTLSQLFSVYTPKICIVMSVVPWSFPLRDEEKF